MTNPIELQPLIEGEPELVMRGVLSVLQGKKFKGKISSDVLNDFHKLVSGCAGRKAQAAAFGKEIQQKATDKCIIRNVAFVAAQNNMISKKDISKRIKDLGLDDLAKEVGDMIAGVGKKIREKEAEDILGLFGE